MVKPLSSRNTISRSSLLKDGSDHKFRRLLYDLDHLNNLMASGRRTIAASIGLSPPQYNVLMLVAQHQQEHGVSISAIARLMHVSGPFITSQSNNLVAMGLVEKIPNPQDGRSILLRLTPTGGAIVEDLIPRLRRFNDLAFGGLTKRQFDVLHEAVDTLIDNWPEAELALPRSARRQDT